MRDCSHTHADGSSCRGHIPRGSPEPLCFYHFNVVSRDARGRFVAFTFRRLFAGGTWKLDVALKGFEVDKDWAEVLRCSPEVRDAFAAEITAAS